MFPLFRQNMIPIINSLGLKKKICHGKNGLDQFENTSHTHGRTGCMCREIQSEEFWLMCVIFWFPSLAAGLGYYYCFVHIISAKNRQLANSFHFEYSATGIHLFFYLHSLHKYIRSKPFMYCIVLSDSDAPGCERLCCPWVDAFCRLSSFSLEIAQKCWLIEFP